MKSTSTSKLYSSKLLSYIPSLIVNVDTADVFQLQISVIDLDY